MSRAQHPGFGMAALVEARERDAQRALLGPEDRAPQAAFEEVPVDAEIQEPGRTVHVWDGKRFVPYLQWLARAVCAVKEPAEPTVPTGARSVVGDCGNVRVRLVEHHGRWLMFVDSGRRKQAVRRKDFASPFFEHAVKTAEQWYGAPGDGWRAENSDGSKTEDLYPQEVSTRSKGHRRKRTR